MSSVTPDKALNGALIMRREMFGTLKYHPATKKKRFPLAFWMFWVGYVTAMMTAVAVHWIANN